MTTPDKVDRLADALERQLELNEERLQQEQITRRDYLKYISTGLALVIAFISGMLWLTGVADKADQAYKHAQDKTLHIDKETLDRDIPSWRTYQSDLKHLRNDIEENCERIGKLEQKN